MNNRRYFTHGLGGLLLLGAAVTATLAEEVQPIFPDKNLEAAVRQFVFEKRGTDQPLTESDLVNLSTIKAVGKGIVDLTGLEKCRSLASLDLGRNKISNLAPLKDLTRLQYLDVSDNGVEDLSPLGSVTALQYIELSRNGVKDVTPLGGLTNLSSLYLSENQVTAIGPLVKLPKLHSLYLDRNRIQSIEGIGGVRWLSSLSLKGNQIKDLAPLKGLTELNYLFLEENKIEEIGPLMEMAAEDFSGRKRFAPFINVYLQANPLTEGAKKQAAEMKEKFGSRMHW